MAAGTTQTTMEQQIASLQAQLKAATEALAMKSAGGTVRISVGEKGGIVFSGTGKHPWAPYLSQLLAVLRFISTGEAEKFIVEKYSVLSQKDEGTKIPLEEVKRVFHALRQGR